MSETTVYTFLVGMLVGCCIMLVGIAGDKSHTHPIWVYEPTAEEVEERTEFQEKYELVERAIVAFMQQYGATCKTWGVEYAGHFESITQAITFLNPDGGDFSQARIDALIEEWHTYEAWDTMCPTTCTLEQNPRCKEHYAHLRNVDIETYNRFVPVRTGIRSDIAENLLLQVSNFIDMYDCSWQTQVHVVEGELQTVQLVRSDAIADVTMDRISLDGERTVMFPGEFPVIQLAFPCIRLLDITFFNPENCAMTNTQCLSI